MGGSTIRRMCGCGKPTMLHGISSKGEPTYKSCCSSCRYEARKHKKDYCEHCGISKDIAALEVDHIDANRSNNDVKNLQTLCTKCHIEKTLKNKENRRRKYE